ncbi:hypothetical protein QFC19_006764 [Naganishia cerealis]|uniref:Uncharacterized protein n=1 Tax=Naganishia cerealis TaxID=610337 RepID=A0ACC2VDV3_9TREE|nr:hypothetical protein QFC19_006764 [Naganishia cerealis]
MSPKEENVDLRALSSIDTSLDSSGRITVYPSTVKLLADLAIIFKRLRERIAQQCFPGSTEGELKEKGLACYDSMAEFIKESKALFPSIGEFIEIGTPPVNPSAQVVVQVKKSKLVWIGYLGKFSTVGFLDDASMEVREYISEVERNDPSHLLKNAATVWNELQASPELAPLAPQIEELMPNEDFDDEDDQFCYSDSQAADDCSMKSGSFVAETSTAENSELRKEGKLKDSGTIASPSEGLDSSSLRTGSQTFTGSSEIENWLQDVRDSSRSLNPVPAWSRSVKDP